MLYFYPAAFTPGCTVEAHEFAEATDKFKALGATVIGVSHDPIDKLNKFSVTECRNKFAVASDADRHISKAYDAVLLGITPILQPHLVCDRTDRQDHLRVHGHESRRSREEHHGAVEKWQAAQKKGT